MQKPTIKTDDLNLWLRPDLERFAERVRGVFFELASTRDPLKVINVAVSSPERGSSRPSVEVIDSQDIGALASGLPDDVQKALSRLLDKADLRTFFKAYVRGCAEHFQRHNTHGIVTVFEGTQGGERRLFSSSQWIVESTYSCTLWATPRERQEWSEILSTTDSAGVFMLGAVSDL